MAWIAQQQQLLVCCVLQTAAEYTSGGRARRPEFVLQDVISRLRASTAAHGARSARNVPKQLCCLPENNAGLSRGPGGAWGVEME